MVIGGLQRFSLIDFPGRISAIVFTQGCNLRCRYCHNPELVDPASYCDSLSEREVLRFLRSRAGRIQGLVITGGEPTIHPDLPRFCREVRDLGYQIKLDTNGTNPDLLGSMIADGLVDYLAVDVKGPPSAFARIAGRARGNVSSEEKIQQSVARVLDSGVPHEFRTTYAPWLLSEDELRGIADLVRGCSTLYVQPFKPTKALDPAVVGMSPPSPDEMERAVSILRQMGIPANAR